MKISDTSPSSLAPLFTDGPDPSLNACVGMNGGQLGDHAYMLGFAQAAIALVRTAISPPLQKQSVASLESSANEGDIGSYIDALVYPICFCARHHIELFLKRQIVRLARVRTIDVDKSALSNHKLSPLLDELLRVCHATDSTLHERLQHFEGAIRELDAFDSEGQTFRYRRSNENKLHLQEVSNINLGTLGAGLERLFSATEDFDNYVDELIYEYQQGSFTSKLSREKLIELAKALPPKSSWGNSSIFDAIKKEFRRKYNLSNNDFQKAVRCILKGRGFSGYVEVELPLPHLKPELLTKFFAMEVTKEQLDTIPKDVWLVLETVGEVGRPYQFPELFDDVMEKASKSSATLKKSTADESQGVKVVREKLEYLEGIEPKSGDKCKEGQDDDDDENYRDPSPPDVVRMMFRSTDRFINGLEKLQQYSLLAALHTGDAVRVKQGRDEEAKFEKMVREWYYRDRMGRARK